MQTQNRVLRKIEVAVRACRRKRSIKWKVARYIGTVQKGNCCGSAESLVSKHSLLCVWGTRNFAILNQTFRFLRKLLSVPKKSNSHQTTPFYETHNLLFTQIKLCLFIKNHKSLRSKITLLYRFKIFRAILHTVTNSHKNFLIALSLRFIKQLHRSEF